MCRPASSPASWSMRIRNRRRLLPFPRATRPCDRRRPPALARVPSAAGGPLVRPLPASWRSVPTFRFDLAPLFPLFRPRTRAPTLLFCNSSAPRGFPARPHALRPHSLRPLDGGRARRDCDSVPSTAAYSRSCALLWPTASARSPHPRAALARRVRSTPTPHAALARFLRGGACVRAWTFCREGARRRPVVVAVCAAGERSGEGRPTGYSSGGRAQWAGPCKAIGRGEHAGSRRPGARRVVLGRLVRVRGRRRGTRKKTPRWEKEGCGWGGGGSGGA